MGDFLKQGSGSLVKSGLKIPRRYRVTKEESDMENLTFGEQVKNYLKSQGDDDQRAGRAD